MESKDKKSEVKKNDTKREETKITGKKKAGLTVLACVILAVLGILSWKMLFSSYQGSVTAKVYQDGVLIQTFSLDKEEGEREIVIENEDGGVNTLKISKDGIGISEADCPDQVCVKRGIVFYSAVPIICMPNKLMIVFEKEGEEKKVD